jgi:hypothetical protein
MANGIIMVKLSDEELKGYIYYTYFSSMSIKKSIKSIKITLDLKLS